MILLAMMNVNMGALVGRRYMEIKMDILANNIANVYTPGYKNSRAFINEKTEGSTKERIFPGLEAIQSYVDFSLGPLIETKNPLDLAIETEGFFVIMTANGRAYTRAGQFTINAEKKLVTKEGMAVLGEGGEIRLDGSDIRIESDGSIFVDGNFVDRLKIVDFENRGALIPAGKCLFLNSDIRNREKAPEKIEVKQGYLESSNVNVMRELLEMIATIRAYEAYTKMEEISGEAKTKLLDSMRF